MTEQRLLDGADRGVHGLGDLLADLTLLVLEQEHQSLPFRNGLQKPQHLLVE